VSADMDGARRAAGVNNHGFLLAADTSGHRQRNPLYIPAQSQVNKLPIMLRSSSVVHEEVPAVQTQPVRSTALPDWVTARRGLPAAAGAILPSRISWCTVRSRSASLWRVPPYPTGGQRA
jgi:hypothetical protein